MNGEKKQKYAYIVLLRETTADHVKLSVAVTLSVDEFMYPLKEARDLHVRTAGYLTNITDALFYSIKKTGLLYMGIGLLIVSLLAAYVGRFFFPVHHGTQEGDTKNQ